MIERKRLLSDLQTLLKRIEADLLQRSEASDLPEVGQRLQAEYERAQAAERTALNYEDWRNDAITQAAAAWVLSCVFVRFLEDNELISPARISGPGKRLQRARDEHELYFRAHPTETDREYLLSIFDELAALPGTKEVFGEHNPIRELPIWLSGDAAGELLQFFQKIEADTGDLIHDFTDPDWNTRFLGDLYQDLSEAARKKYALLQTPEFVEEFILERTLEPALEEFGLHAPSVTDRQGEPITATGFRMIDPACGSGHFLLGAFPRILARWQAEQPNAAAEELVQNTLDCIHGVDVNPYAVAIARFRLLLIAMQACDRRTLAGAPEFRFHLACGDSLLHAPLRISATETQQVFDWEKKVTDDECEHAYQSEDLAQLKQMLRSASYHAVVANPPYITPKDRQLNQRYRNRFDSCHMKYSLAVPFLERIFRMAVPGGYTGQITANSFMKREFGKKLIESFLPKIDLTHVIDSSGAYIPGHGTPTVILLGRHQRPALDTVRTVMGIRGEPTTPDDPARGLVWSAIVDQIDQPGSESEFVSVEDSSRELFGKHPWSIGGGGAAELKELIESTSSSDLRVHSDSIGVMAISGDDDVFLDQQADTWNRRNIERVTVRTFVTGDDVRDWKHNSSDMCLFPYDDDGAALAVIADDVRKYLWPFKTTVSSGLYFGQKKSERGLHWYEYAIVMAGRVSRKFLIHFAAVATHNHFALLRCNEICNRHSPVITLPADATEEDHVGLLGLLNSSTACFWCCQVLHDKGNGGIGGGIAAEEWERFFEWTGTHLQAFPTVDDQPIRRASELDQLIAAQTDMLPYAVLKAWAEEIRQSDVQALPSVSPRLSEAGTQYEGLRSRLIFEQEELDWECYRLYGLLKEDLTYSGSMSIQLGERAFEIVMARKMAAGKLSTTWFERHGSVPITELPAHWPDDYRQLVERRIAVIESDKSIGLIEQPEYKRRWNTEPWGSQLERALRAGLLERLESYFDFDGRMNEEGTPTVRLEVGLTTIAKLADVAAQDPQFMELGELYRQDKAFDVQRLVGELVKAESVPLLPVLRYKPSGLRKRKEWEKTWELQRREDAGEEVGSIPVPPKYKSSDFISSGGARYWALRGKLDVPKERWISFPHCEGPDGTLVIAWAGYDHLQLARALSGYFVDIQEIHGGRDDARLIPLLACLNELLPWLTQWHHAPDPEYNEQMDEVFRSFVREEAKALGLTTEDVQAWTPPKKGGTRDSIT
ncbi:MAG: SAM-dependent methyltransferase [Planctomyces sp.]|nr:SAM-dependent methyltransferase [Planctomyces sp.]